MSRIDMNIMRKLPALIIAFLCVSPVCAQTATSAQGQIFYSADQYPTAQGHFMKLPAGYQAANVQPTAASPGGYQPYAQPVIQPAPQSALTAPRYVAPAQPVPVSSFGAAQSVTVSTVETKPVIYPQAAAASASGPPSYDDMPTYSYSKSTDPNANAYVTPKANDAISADKGNGSRSASGTLSLATLPTYEVGLQISEYRYKEFDPSGAEFISLKGPTVGLTFDAAQTFGSGWFVGENVRATYGDHDYDGGDVDITTGVVTPSTKNGISDWMFDARVTGGRDYLIHDAMWDTIDIDLSPYIGVGFRYLYDDNEGTDSNGVAGYERFSHYFYMPVGLMQRYRLTENSRLSVDMEYDQLLYGWQVSSLGESIAGASDITNDQNHGFGLRGSIMYERKHWSVGPFFEYWDIGQSDTACVGSSFGTLCGDEPHNTTLEYGIQGKYRF